MNVHLIIKFVVQNGINSQPLTPGKGKNVENKRNNNQANK